MNCKYHENLKGTNTCSVCGCWLCEHCALEINGRIYCKDCLKNEAKNKEIFNNQKYPSSTSSPYIKPPVRKSGFLTIILSLCYAGLGQMYLGYLKRGLLICSIFTLGIFYSEVMFFPIIIVTYFLSIFDALKLKNNLDRGIYKEDSLSDVKNFLLENKFFIFILALMVFLPMVSNFLFDLSYTFTHLFDIHGYNIPNLLRLLIVILLIILICVSVKNKGNKKDNDNKKQ